MSKKRFILSDESKINSKGFKVSLAGIDASRFDTNPVMLYNHNDENVVGRWSDLKIEDGKLSATPVFDTDDELGKKISGKVERGFLRGASLGIIPKNVVYVDDVPVVSKSELLEASIVSIPADAGATVLYNENRQILSEQQLKLMFNQNKTKIIMNEERKLVLSAATLTALGLSAEPNALDVERAVADKDRQIEALRAELKAQKDAAIAAYLEGAVKADKITEAEKAHFATLAAKDFDAVKSLLDAKAEKPSTSLKEMVVKSNVSSGREDWDYVRWMKEDSAGLEKMKNENPAAFKALQETLKK
jgi:HK97 family phage prohead protease